MDVKIIDSIQGGAHEAVEDQKQGVELFVNSSGATLCDRCYAILGMVDEWPCTLAHRNIHSLEASAREGCVVCLKFVQSAPESFVDELHSQTSISDTSSMVGISRCSSCAEARRGNGGFEPTDYSNPCGAWSLDWSPNTVGHVVIEEESERPKCDYHKPKPQILSTRTLAVEGLSQSHRWIDGVILGEQPSHPFFGWDLSLEVILLPTINILQTVESKCASLAVRKSC
jgi:hypothetical protein